MFISRIKIQRQEGNQWEEALYVGEQENSDKSIILDTNYQPITELFNTSKPQSSLMMSIPGGVSERGIGTRGTIGLFSSISTTDIPPTEEKIMATKTLSLKEVQLDCGVLSGSLSKRYNISMQLEVNLDEKLLYRLIWVKGDCVKVYCNKKQISFQETGDREIVRKVTEFFIDQGLYEGIPGFDPVAIEVYSEVFWRGMGL